MAKSKKKSSQDLDALFSEDSKSSTAPEAAFESLLAESWSGGPRRFRVGDRFRSELLTFGKEESFVSLSPSQEAVIFTRELLDENQQAKFKVGDILDVVVMQVRGDEVRVSRPGQRSQAVDDLEDAFDMELPVEGKVSEAVNGGVRVVIQGQTAFCPFSQLDLKYIGEVAPYIGQKFEFLITQFDPNRRNIVVSRRKLLELRRGEAQAGWSDTHKVGDILSGVVSRLESFGAFVDLGEGLEGLVHVSEIGFVRLKTASEALKIGEAVQVKILKIDTEKDRLKISLSIKQAGGVGDPWMQVPMQYPVGTLVEARVQKREQYGIFLSIAPGIQGLLPRSKWRDSLEGKVYETARIDDLVKVRVDEIQYEERRLTFGLPIEAEDESWKDYKNTSTFGGSLAQAFASANSGAANSKSKK